MKSAVQQLSQKPRFVVAYWSGRLRRFVTGNHPFLSCRRQPWVPTRYDRQKSFAIQRGEPNAVKLALDDNQQNLAKIQDSDDVLKRGSVGRAQFDASVSLGFAAPKQWAAGFA